MNVINVSGPPHESITLRVELSQIAPDRTQYKPYSPVYQFDHTYVAVEVPRQYVAYWNQEEDVVVLTPDGVAFVADVLASALDRMHDEFRNRDRKF